MERRATGFLSISDEDSVWSLLTRQSGWTIWVRKLIRSLQLSDPMYQVPVSPSAKCGGNRGFFLGLLEEQ